MRNPVTLWVLRGVDAGDVRCTFEQIAEGCFELSVVGPRGLVAREPFADTASLLARADQLHSEAERQSRYFFISRHVPKDGEY